MSFGLPFGLLGCWPFTEGEVDSASPKMLLAARPEWTGLLRVEGAPGSPNIPLFFPPETNKRHMMHIPKN